MLLKLVILDYVSEDLVALVVRMTTSRDGDCGTVQRDVVSTLAHVDRDVSVLRRKIADLFLPCFELREILRIPAGHVQKRIHVELLEWRLLSAISLFRHSLRRFLGADVTKSDTAASCDLFGLGVVTFRTADNVSVGSVEHEISFFT